MAPWTLREILEATGAANSIDTELVCARLCTDTRDIQAGDLFIPLVGERFDGHDYVAQALSGGAVLALWSRPGEAPAGTLRVSDTLDAYQALASYHYRHRLRLPVVAVTGSTGKTTTKDLTAALLAPLGPIYKTPGNFNNDVGVARCLLELEPHHKAAVLELAMRGPGQIRRLARLIHPQVGMITNIGVSHIELLGSREAIADAKAELLEYVTGVSFLPFEDEYFSRLRAHARGRVVAFSGQPGHGDLAPTELENRGLEGWRLTVEGHRLELPLPGPHMLSDFMAALGAARELGVPLETVNHSLADLKMSAMRLEVTQTSHGRTLLNDAYNAAPDSMRGALEVLSYALGRKVAVLGDMLELGPVEVESHRLLGRDVAGKGVDLLVAVGPRSQEMARAAREAGLTEVYWAEDAERARPLVEQHVRPGDTVLLKASRGIGLDRLASSL